MTTVLFVGDSITVGLVGYASGKTAGSSFRASASAALGWRAVGPFSDPNKLLHGGVGGSTTYTFENGSAQFTVVKGEPLGEEKSTWVLKYQPDVIHLMLGFNDIVSFNEAPLELYNRLMGLAGGAVIQQRRTGRRGYVLLSTICESMFPAQVTRARVLNDFIKKTSEIGKDYTIRGVDSAGAFNAALDQHEPLRSIALSKYTVDGSHPNQAGYDMISGSLVKAVGGGVKPSGASSGKSTGSRVLAAGLISVAGYGAGKYLKWW